MQTRLHKIFGSIASIHLISFFITLTFQQIIPFPFICKNKHKDQNISRDKCGIHSPSVVCMPLFEHLESRQNNVRLDMKFSIGLWNSWILYVDDSKVAQPNKKEEYSASL